MGTTEDRLNEQARAEGWTSRGQKYRAAKAGVTDPAEWNARTTGSVITLDELDVDDVGSDVVGSGVVWSEPSLDDAIAELAPLTLDLQGGDIGSIVMVAAAVIHPAPDNPRCSIPIDDEMLTSMRTFGFRTSAPMLITSHPSITGEWMIVAGHRRHAHAVAAGITRVPCLVRAYTSERERAEEMVLDNLHRENLNPFEEAMAFATLGRVGFTQREIADRVGRNQSHISRRLKLVDLEPELVEHFTTGAVTLRVLEELAVLGPEIRHAAVGILAKSPGIHESNIIPKAEKVVATAKVRLQGKESGLPEWTGESWDTQTVEQPQATHWMLHEEYLLGRWLPTIRWVREIPRDIPAATSNLPSAKETKRREQEQAERDAIAAAKKTRIKQRRAFITTHLDDLADLAIRLVATAPETDFFYEDELEGPLELLGYDIPEPDDSSEWNSTDAWTEIAAAASTKRQVLRMFTARAIDAADYHLTAGARHSDTSWWPTYLTGLQACGWELDETEQTIIAPPAADAEGITDEDNS
jgi:ParB/RepB/Spo0J family partition protein